MSRKLRRGRRNVFRKKRIWVKQLIWVLVFVLLAAGGFFLASLVLGDDKAPAASSSDTSSEISQESSVTTPETSLPETEEMVTPVPDAPVRAVYVPLAVLREKAAQGLDAWLQALSEAGHNSVVVQLKDFTGNVYYQSATQGAVTADVVTENAIPMAELTSLREQLAGKGFRLIPQLSAFYDALAPRRLVASRIPYGPDPSQCWLDDAPAVGGKAWLNPYADEAHEYILGYITELRESGFATLLLDGVQFPFQTHLAGFDTTVHKGKSRAEVLSLFVSRAKAAMGENGYLMLAAKGLAATSIDVKLYGDNPVDFGADCIVPQLYISELGSVQTFAGSKVNVAEEPVKAVTLAARQIVTRPDYTGKVTVAVQVKDFTGEQLAEVLAAINAELGDGASYMLYAADGTYN